MGRHAESKIITDFLAQIAALTTHAKDPDLRAEQEPLRYLCLTALWQLLNNAFQNDGLTPLSNQQIHLLQQVDIQVQASEALTSTALHDQVRQLLRPDVGQEAKLS
jgi:hypothetical protein